MNRRNFLRITGLSSMAFMSMSLKGMADPLADRPKLIPVDKNLDPAWLKSLFERGAQSVFTGADIKYVGMPVGGICTGQMYLSGEGKLWLWDIFNKLYDSGCSGPHYLKPMVPSENTPVDQGFAIQLTSGADSTVHTLDAAGFPQLSFQGEYPIGTVEYKNDALPIGITLKAFSPFVPLNADDSGLPATIFRFMVKNTSSNPVEAVLSGWLQNAVYAQRKTVMGTWERRNEVITATGCTLLNCSMDDSIENDPTYLTEDILIEDWKKETYTGWKTEGTAFGTGPVLVTALPKYMNASGADTERIADSQACAPGDTYQEKDAQIGKLTSDPFTIQRDNIHAWICGGANLDQVSFNIVVEGKPIARAAGANNNLMEPRGFDVKAWKGKQATIEIIDSGTKGWGNIGVGRILQSDKATLVDPKKVHDFGTMGLALLGAPAEQIMASGAKNGFGGVAEKSAAVSLDQTLVGALGRKLSLKPGESASVDFVITWHFPNLIIRGIKGTDGHVGRYYSAKFPSAQTVAQYISDNFPRLSSQTELWHDTWYNKSTLPYWFLDRTFSSVSTLATSTPYRFADGRFYSWEGVGSCPGTCTHVWGYAHSVARVFPELERYLREHIDFGLSQNPGTGVSGFRGEFDRNLAVDGQSCVLLRTYREHQMSADAGFLTRIWPQVKKGFNPLLALDADRDGIMEGSQMNTLDVPWYGQISWMSSLYVAALRAGEQMATEMGDTDFATQCRTIAENGTKNITEKLFNGEYFINKLDPQHLDSVNSGTGCEIDQVFGQGWGHQVGLPRILPEKETQSALRALWKYNFAPDVGPYMAVYKEYRPYFAPGEAGLLMCTFPQPGWDYEQAKGKGPFFAVRYFNEFWTGTEHQAAGNMIWDGLVQEGLAVERAVHDRHHPSKRNPWNEIECGDHYSRAMSSYGVYTAASGYEYHGPKGHIGFSPRLTPENFQAAFIAAEGWGTFSQQIDSGTLTASIETASGKLKLNTVALTLPSGVTAKSVAIEINGEKADATFQQTAQQVVITVPKDTTLQEKGKIKLVLS